MQNQSQLNFNHTLSHTTGNCGYPIVLAPKYRIKEIRYRINTKELGTGKESQ